MVLTVLQSRRSSNMHFSAQASHEFIVERLMAIQGSSLAWFAGESAAEEKKTTGG